MQVGQESTLKKTIQVKHHDENGGATMGYKES